MRTSDRPLKARRGKASRNGGGRVLTDAQLVSELGRRALTQTNVGVVMEDALETVNARLGAELVNILELVPGGEGFLLIAGLGWQPGYVGQVVVPLTPESQAGYTMTVGHTVIVDDLRKETRFRGMPLLHEHGVVSGISAILQGHDRAHGIMAAHSRERRSFSADDITFFESVATVVAAAMDRHHTEKELLDAHQRLSLALEAGRLGAWEYNPHTRRVIWSDEIYRTYGLEPGQFGGTVDDYMELIHPADRGMVGQLITEALETGQLEMQYRITRPDGEVRWLMSRGMVVHDERGEPLRMTGVCSDETDQRLHEMHVATQYSVTRALAEAESLADALHGVLTAICKNLDWPVGHMWLVGGTSDLRLFDSCQTAPFEHSSFEEVSGSRTFAKGIGLPGTVLESGGPIWLEDLATAKNFPRAVQARESGLRSAFGFPVLLNREVIGVMEFFSSEPRKERPELLEAMTAIGSQVGEYVKRRSTEVERERLIVELKVAETRYRSVFEQANDAILVADSDGRFIEANEAAMEMLGYTHDELLDLALGDLVVGFLPGMFSDINDDGHWSGELELRRRTRAPVSVEIRATKITLPAGDVFVAVARDITERRLHQDQREFLSEASTTLGASLDYEETLANLARMCVPFLGDWCTIDMIEGDQLRRMAIVHSDPAKVQWAEEFRKRYPPFVREESGPAGMLLSGQSLRLPIVTENVVRAVSIDEEMAETLLGLGLKSVMIVPIAAHGKTLGLLTLATVESDRIYTVTDQALAEDVGRRAGLAVDNARLYRESREAQEKLKEANAAKDEFLGLISHEMRTPMTTIHGGSRLLRRSWQRIDEDSRDALLGDIEQQTERLQRIVEDLLALARIELGEEVQTEPVLAQRLVDQAVASYKKRRPNRAIELHEDPGVPPVSGSPIYLEQVLLNLLSNADKYSPPDQAIEVHTEMREGQAVISVLDRGPGIGPDDMERIFERFYRSAATAERVGGAGIGLTVCKRLIEALNGTIWAEHREGGGLIVSFSLQPYDELA